MSSQATSLTRYYRSSHHSNFAAPSAFLYAAGPLIYSSIAATYNAPQTIAIPTKNVICRKEGEKKKANIAYILLMFNS